MPPALAQLGTPQRLLRLYCRDGVPRTFRCSYVQGGDEVLEDNVRGDSLYRQPPLVSGGRLVLKRPAPLVAELPKALD